MSAMVETKNLAKSFGSIKAVDDLSFTVNKGEVLGFLGPNGAGKSTTMKIITCFLTPDGGTATVCGCDILSNSMEVRANIGYLPETAPAYADMTVLGFLKYVARIRNLGGANMKSALDRVIDKCHLEGVLHQTFETLSKGYKRRTCLAQALLHDPPVLIMDEPTDGLDPNQKQEVRNLIAEMAREKCIILSTHILEEVEAVCTRAIIIDEGKLVADYTPRQMRELDERHGAVTLSLNNIKAEEAQGALKSVPFVSRVEVGTSVDGVPQLVAIPDKGAQIAVPVAELVRDKQWSVEEFHVERGQLDAVFRKLTQKGGQGR